MLDFEILDWDSDAFGFKVARIRAPTHSLTSLGDCLRKLRREQVALAYWFADDRPELTQIATECQGSLVDRKVTYTQEISPPVDAAFAWPRQIQHARSTDIAALESLSIQCGEYSRFARDPRFPRDRFELMYREWIRKSLDGSLADRVLVWREDDGLPQGLITVSVKDKLSQIGLFGVDAQSRGRGIGRLLVQAAHTRAHERGATRCDVVTQQENLAACRMYEYCGFAVRTVQRVHHFWLAGKS